MYKIVGLIVIALFSLSSSHKKEARKDLVGTWAYIDKHKGYSEIQFTVDLNVFQCTQKNFFQSAGYKAALVKDSILIYRPQDNSIVHKGLIRVFKPDFFEVSFDQKTIETKNGKTFLYKLNNTHFEKQLDSIKDSTDTAKYLEGFYTRKDSMLTIIK